MIYSRCYLIIGEWEVRYFGTQLLVRSNVIHFAWIGVDPPWLVTLQAMALCLWRDQSRGNNSNVGKVDQTWSTTELLRSTKNVVNGNKQHWHFHSVLHSAAYAIHRYKYICFCILIYWSKLIPTLSAFRGLF